MFWFIITVFWVCGVGWFFLVPREGATGPAPAQSCSKLLMSVSLYFVLIPLWLGGVSERLRGALLPPGLKPRLGARQLQGMTPAGHLFLLCIIGAWLLGFAPPSCQNSCPPLKKGYEQGAQCREKFECWLSAPWSSILESKDFLFFCCNKYFDLTPKSTDFSLGR